jgi:hypothetical protein
MTEWTTVSDGTEAPEPEVKIVFEEHGDEFIGEFLGYRHLTDRESGQSYTQARFRDDGGEICYTRANHSMKEGLDRVSIGSMTRIVYVDDVDTGMASPMRAFTVQTAGRAATAIANSSGASGRPVRRATSKKPATTKPAGEKA